MGLWHSWVHIFLSKFRKSKNEFVFRVEHSVSEIFQPIIMMIFTWSLLAISGVMLIIQVEIVAYTFIFGNWRFALGTNYDFIRILKLLGIICSTFPNFCSLSSMFKVHHGNIMPLLLSISNGTLALATVFIACELGQRLTDGFNDIELTIDQFAWYLFPIEVKRMLPMIIADAQQPVYLECFGSIGCTREVFKSVSWYEHSTNMEIKINLMFRDSCYHFYFSDPSQSILVFYGPSSTWRLKGIFQRKAYRVSSSNFFGTHVSGS